MIYPEAFVGGYGPEYGPEAFKSWVESLDSYIGQNQVSSWESLSFAINLLRGEAKSWWKVEEEARWDDEEPIYTWNELKIIMSFKYVPGFQWEEEESDLNFFLKEIEQPDSLPEDSLPMIAAEHEGETQELCLHVPDQTNQEEKVLGESSTTSELAHALIDQGESFQSLSSGLLTWYTLDFQTSLVEYLRDVKGLQQVVFEPGGSFSVSIRSNNNLVQKTVTYKLDLQGFFTPEKQDLRSNLFEGREDGVILSICSKNRGETGGNTPLISPITDQNQLRSIKQKLAVVKKMPKLENEYGNHSFYQ